uniref:TMhelix containing protein n=1 Tax=Panagrellus redivivus TaxID=6233 RepID=A0A7E4UX26_PANRE
MTALYVIVTVALVFFSFAWREQNEWAVILFAEIANKFIDIHQVIGIVWLVVICRSMMKKQTSSGQTILVKSEIMSSVQKGAK